MTMARVFAPIPRILTRTFAVPSAAVWTRYDDEGNATSDEIRVLFNSSSEVADADGISMRYGVPVARCALADAVALEPTRAPNPQEIFRNDGTDELTIDGKIYEIESCSSDGYGMLTVTLRG